MKNAKHITMSEVTKGMIFEFDSYEYNATFTQSKPCKKVATVTRVTTTKSGRINFTYKDNKCANCGKWSNGARSPTSALQS